MNSNPTAAFAPTSSIVWTTASDGRSAEPSIVSRLAASMRRWRNDRRALAAVRRAGTISTGHMDDRHDQLLRHHSGVMFRAS